MNLVLLTIYVEYSSGYFMAYKGCFRLDKARKIRDSYKKLYRYAGSIIRKL